MLSVSLSYFKDLLYKILIYFYKDFFGKVKNGQKKCPNLENGNTSWKKNFDETINFFSVWSPKINFKIVTVIFEIY